MLYRMVSMVGPLHCKPLMQGHDKGRVLGAVANLCPIWECGVLDIDVLGTRLQCGQAWHVLPVNFRWIRAICVLLDGSLAVTICRPSLSKGWK
jgi:hypothetical protein